MDGGKTVLVVAAIFLGLGFALVGIGLFVLSLFGVPIHVSFGPLP